MDTPKANLRDIIEKAKDHFVKQGKPPALTENGVYGLRVQCSSEPFIRFDTVGLSIPDHLFCRSMLDYSISEILDPQQNLCSQELRDYFTEIDVEVLQELQDVHDNLVVNRHDEFRERIGASLEKFAEKHGLGHASTPSVKRFNYLCAFYLASKGMSKSEACFHAGITLRTFELECASMARVTPSVEKKVQKWAADLISKQQKLFGSLSEEIMGNGSFPPVVTKSDLIQRVLYLVSEGYDTRYACNLVGLSKTLFYNVPEKQREELLASSMSRAKEWFARLDHSLLERGLKENKFKANSDSGTRKVNLQAQKVSKLSRKERKRQIEEKRHSEVRRVELLQENGYSISEAFDLVSISRSVYYDRKSRMGEITQKDRDNFTEWVKSRRIKLKT
jgi:predicted outer membrane protein